MTPVITRIHAGNPKVPQKSFTEALTWTFLLDVMLVIATFFNSTGSLFRSNIRARRSGAGAFIITYLKHSIRKVS